MVKAESLSVGEKIKQARKKKNLEIQDLANKAGCSDEYLEWIEEDQVSPPVALLIQLAKVLQLNSSAFLEASDTSDTRIEEVVKRTEHYSYKTLTPPEPGVHLMAFSVTIPPKRSHEEVVYKHEGEEFVFVQSGQVDVIFGQDRKRLHEKEFLRFNSNLDHHIENPSTEEAELLVVLYVP